MRASRFAVLTAVLPVLIGGAVAAIAPAEAAAPAVAAPARPGGPRPAIHIARASLSGVAVVSGHGAWAVGSRIIGDAAHVIFRPLIMRWDGVTWEKVPSPAFTNGGFLDGVAMTSANRAWAVGGTITRHGGDCPCRALIEHWNGTAWKQVPSPAPANSYLRAVAVVSIRSAFALGTITRPSGRCPCQPRIEHWNGTAWKQFPSPHPAHNTHLSAIAAVSARSVWAVGTIGRRPGGCPCRALIEHWNGTAWREVPAPAKNAATLTAVTALSAHDAWAVGQGGDGKALIEHWDGTSWKQVPSPVRDTAKFSAVAAGSARSVWAAGALSDDSPLIEHWDGTSWKPSRRGGSGPPQESYNALAASSARNAWAVGDFSAQPTTEAGLILHWDGTAWK